MKLKSVAKNRPFDHRSHQGSALAAAIFVGAMTLGTLVAAWRWPIDLSAIQVRSTSIRLDVNQVDADTLSVLPGIGPRLSKRVVRWREKVGGFSNIDELQDVPGVGPVFLARIRPFIDRSAEN